jgi:replicative DNA helicase
VPRAAKAGLERPPKHDPDSIVLPHNLDAERSLLGAALLYEQQADYVVDRLTAAVFYRRVHQTIFEAIQELRQRGRGVDLTLLSEQLGPKRLEDVGGLSYLSALTDGVPRGRTSRTMPTWSGISLRSAGSMSSAG